MYAIRSYYVSSLYRRYSGWNDIYGADLQLGYLDMRVEGVIRDNIGSGLPIVHGDEDRSFRDAQRYPGLDRYLSAARAHRDGIPVPDTEVLAVRGVVV